MLYNTFVELIQTFHGRYCSVSEMLSIFTPVIRSDHYINRKRNARNMRFLCDHLSCNKLDERVIFSQEVHPWLNLIGVYKTVFVSRLICREYMFWYDY